MPKYIAFINTETNGLHKHSKFNVTIKNLDLWARLVKLQYHIGYRDEKSGKFILTKKVDKLIKPHHFLIDENVSKINNITTKKAEKKGENIIDVLNEFKTDIKNVSVIVSHNLEFHLKTLQAEMLRWVIVVNFNNYILIDTINFFHQLEYPKLKILSKHILNKKYKNKSRKYNIVIIRKIFFKLYEMFEKQVKEQKKCTKKID